MFFGEPYYTYDILWIFVILKTEIAFCVVKYIWASWNLWFQSLVNDGPEYQILFKRVAWDTMF